MTYQSLYASWPEGARRSWGFGALGVLALGYLISSIAVALALIIYALSDLIGQVDFATASPEDIESLFSAAVLSATQEALGLVLLVQFGVWFLFTLIWVKAFENRNMASLGIEGRGLIGRYLLGLVLGLGLVVMISLVLTGLTSVFGASEAMTDAADISMAEMDFSRLGEQEVLIGLGLLALLFLFQGGVEEFIFRGWLMSALTARWGKTAGVIVASFIFAVFHLHVLISGLVFGIVALTGIGFTGLVFSLGALWRRSIVEAIAAHGAFNAALVISPTVVMLASEPDRRLSDILAEVFTSATGTAGADQVSVGPELAAQPLTMGLISIVLLIVLVSRSNKSA